MNGNQEMKPIRLDLYLHEINIILEALGQMPYSKVYQLIGKIQQHAKEQLQEDEGKNPQNER